MLYGAKETELLTQTGNHILLKPDNLTPEEFEVMKTHTTIGCNVLHRAELAMGITCNGQGTRNFPQH